MNRNSFAQKRLEVILGQLSFFQRLKVKCWIYIDLLRFDKFIKKIDGGASILSAYKEAKK